MRWVAGCGKWPGFRLALQFLSGGNIERRLSSWPWPARRARPLVAAIVSRGIALLEYLLQVPANRIGYTILGVGQLKIIQEVIDLSVFVPFSLLYLKAPLKPDCLWAGLCLLGAVFFMFRGKFM